MAKPYCKTYKKSLLNNLIIQFKHNVHREQSTYYYLLTGTTVQNSYTYEKYVRIIIKMRVQFKAFVKYFVRYGIT